MKVGLAWLVVIVFELLRPRGIQRGANGCYFSVGEVHRHTEYPND